MIYRGLGIQFVIMIHLNHHGDLNDHFKILIDIDDENHFNSLIKELEGWWDRCGWILVKMVFVRVCGCVHLCVKKSKTKGIVPNGDDIGVK